MAIFNKNEINEKNFLSMVEKFRKKNIPKQFNQIQLINELLNKDIDHYISISNRTDGKTFNYVHFFLYFAYHTDIQLLFLSRDFMLRKSYQDLILELIEMSPYFESEHVRIMNTQFYREIFYKDKTIAFISDLNGATDLKYFSSKLKYVGIIIYDEFLAIESDYLPDEWEKLKTIYSSVNRNFNLKLLKYPKVFYFGNAVNLSSPILAHLDIFSSLETQPVNSMRIYNNICIELRKNENVNEKRNLRAFDEKKDPLTMGQFKVNNYNVALENDLKRAYNNIIVKLKDNFLKIQYSDNYDIIVLEIIGYAPSYSYNILPKDNKKTSIYLDDKYFDTKNFKKHLNNIYLYNNNYSKDYILTTSNGIGNLDIIKIIKNERNKLIVDTNFINNNKSQSDASYIELSKRSILSRLL